VRFVRRPGGWRGGVIQDRGPSSTSAAVFSEALRDVSLVAVVAGEARSD
jgi:hypothetical protein